MEEDVRGKTLREIRHRFDELERGARKPMLIIERDTRRLRYR